MEPGGHLDEHGRKGINRNLALVVQHLHEARHVRALEVMGQVHVHVEGRDRVLLAGRAVLDAHRMADVLDADAVDGNAARVHAALHILDAELAAVTIDHGNVHGAPFVVQDGPERTAVAILVAVRPAFKLRACGSHQRSIAATTAAVSTPASARHCSPVPCSMKRSGSPRCRRGPERPAASSNSATALPAPPATVFSSSVTSARCRGTDSRRSASSSGLTKRMLTTVASSRSPATRAAASIGPNDSNNSPEAPRRRNSARPTGRALLAASTRAPGPWPRG